MTRTSGGAVPPNTQVFLVDTLGELPPFYAAGDVAFVGGTLVPIGGHNLLEPAALSLPILALSLLVYGWFAAALGIWISLQLRSTWRAQFLTVAGLLLLNLSGQAILSNFKRWAPFRSSPTPSSWSPTSCRSPRHGRR